MRVCRVHYCTNAIGSVNIFVLLPFWDRLHVLGIHRKAFHFSKNWLATHQGSDIHDLCNCICLCDISIRDGCTPSILLCRSIVLVISTLLWQARLFLGFCVRTFWYIWPWSDGIETLPFSHSTTFSLGFVVEAFTLFLFSLAYSEDAYFSD